MACLAGGCLAANASSTAADGVETGVAVRDWSDLAKFPRLVNPSAIAKMPVVSGTCSSGARVIAATSTPAAPISSSPFSRAATPLVIGRTIGRPRSADPLVVGQKVAELQIGVCGLLRVAHRGRRRRGWGGDLPAAAERQAAESRPRRVLGRLDLAAAVGGGVAPGVADLVAAMAQQWTASWIWSLKRCDRRRQEERGRMCTWQ
ncbi:unnamed protein product [Closterium sp. Naga37s-1]|nr:unnamed protein product [Closterium sp. Naga37s-1]